MGIRMKTISLCMIVRDEEDVLERCLLSVIDIVDEIIIVDTGSKDNTKQIAANYTNKIYDFKWIDDFSAARNYAFEQATKDFILWLDADDVLLKKDRKKLKRLKEQLTDFIDVVMLPYNVGFDENGILVLSYNRERIVRREKAFKWKNPVHEYLDVNGNIIYSNVAVTHKKEHEITDRNLQIYEKYIQSGKEITARDIYYYAKELLGNGRYEKAIEYFHTFLEGKDGWKEDKISACFYQSFCYGNLKREENFSIILECLCKSFRYDKPRAEICCRMGDLFQAQKQYELAIYWYTAASNSKLPDSHNGFILHDYWGYYPHIQMCVSYDCLGRLAEAKSENELAATYKPDNKAVAYNREYFAGKNV